MTASSHLQVVDRKATGYLPSPAKLRIHIDPEDNPFNCGESCLIRRELQIRTVVESFFDKVCKSCSSRPSDEFIHNTG